MLQNVTSPVNPSAKRHLSKAAGQQIILLSPSPFSPHPQRVTVETKGRVPDGLIWGRGTGSGHLPENFVEVMGYLGSSTRRLSLQKCGLRSHRTQGLTRDKKDPGWNRRRSPELWNTGMRAYVWTYICGQVLTITELEHLTTLFLCFISQISVLFQKQLIRVGKENQKTQKSLMKKISPSSRETFNILYLALWSWQTGISLRCFEKLGLYSIYCFLYVNNVLWTYFKLRVYCEWAATFPRFSALV